VPETLSYRELLEAWPVLGDEERVDGFSILPREEADQLFEALEPHDQLELLRLLPEEQRGRRVEHLEPDDAADLLQEASAQEQTELIQLLDAESREEVQQLMQYETDQAGGLMTPRFADIRPDETVEQAVARLRRTSRGEAEHIYYAYVLDERERLIGVVSLRELVTAPASTRVRDLMRTELLSVRGDADQEQVSGLFARHDLLSLPVVDADGRMIGIVTVDDIVDVVQEEATEDIHKAAAVGVLEAPYLQVSLLQLLAKRAPWLVALLIMQFVTVLAMKRYSTQLETVVALALFVPLIISAGGNAGSQAATLIIRAMALGEVAMRDWLRVIGRELAIGASLGSIMGLVGLAGVLTLDAGAGALGLDLFSGHAARLGGAVALSVLAVALWGTLIGSTLPFLLRAARLDPATASAPLVATLLDATGLVIYFSVATVLLRGALV
jgi:magnesium transporter